MLQDKKVLTIIGFPRSGTTMLRSILANHPKCIVHQIEPQWIRDFWLKYHVREVAANEIIDFLVHHSKFPSQNRWSHLNISEKVLAEIFANDLYSLKEIVFLVFDFLYKDELNDSSRNVFVFKHPDLIFHQDVLEYLFSDKLYVIHMYRDPRASISSYLARWKNKGVKWASKLWIDSIEAGRKATRSSFRFKLLQLKYEELLVNDVNVLNKLLSTDLELSFYREIIDQEKEIRKWDRSNAQVQREVVKGVDKTKLAKWKKSLSEQEVKKIELHCHPIMDELGYELEYPDRRLRINNLPFYIADELKYFYFINKSKLGKRLPKIKQK